MSSIGPELPPHLLAKRKRLAEQEDARVCIPEADLSRSASPDGGEKRRRVIGPAAPPAPIAELPPKDVEHEGSSSDSDDDFGPALPTGDARKHEYNTETENFPSRDDASPPASEKKVERDAWMMVPPKQDDLSSRMDPTKLRARKFNTGKGARAPNQGGGGDNAIWTETPEQKRKRLENEVLGVSAPTGGPGTDNTRSARSAEDEETARRLKEHREKDRGKSLYVQHQKSNPREKEDDPSKRAFDKEKDIGGGMKIGHAQRREMLNRAADFGSRFSGGSYL